MRYYIAPLFLLFSAVDFIYKPEQFKEWFIYRLIFLIYVYISFQAIIKFKILRKNIKFFAITVSVSSCWIITKMIISSGGYNSLYVSGLILCSITGIQIFRFKSRESFYIQMTSYLPVILYFIFSASSESIHFALIQSSFLLAMSVLSIIYKNSDDELESFQKKFKKRLDEEVHRLKNVELFSRHFPTAIRDSIEKNPNFFLSKQVYPLAVVGFADIVASTRISNTVSSNIEWALKDRFIDVATKRALESEMVVLTSTGDGFLFIANYNPGSYWFYNLIVFYENLIKDYDELFRELNLDSVNIPSGLKFGITQGETILGFMGKYQSSYTACGPDVNLAARLCDRAKPNQMVVSSRVWHSLKPFLVGWAHEMIEYSDLKGFDITIPTVHVYPRNKGEENSTTICSECNSSMSLIKTEDGILDYRCVNGHSSPKISPKVKLKSLKSA